jgi:AraC family transcriptional regulator of adaptative response/methylated-DNA-[protein]-cysteine methyltransferase
MAQLDAGYESGSGFRDAFAKIMGAPPASSAARALFAAWLDTSLGAMTAIGDEDALYLLEYADRRGLERQIARLRACAKAGIVPGRTGPIAQIEAELAAYFDGSSMRFETPLARLGSVFQNAVWDALLAIPPEQTRSYAELARAVGRPEAVRAAAQANGANPFAIVVPCHRVINADGTLCGYGGGLPRKHWLLEHGRRWTSAAAAECRNPRLPERTFLRLRGSRGAHGARASAAIRAVPAGPRAQLASAEARRDQGRPSSVAVTLPLSS